jgi:hypothetical protein
MYWFSIKALVITDMSMVIEENLIFINFVIRKNIGELMPTNFLVSQLSPD